MKNQKSGFSIFFRIYMIVLILISAIFLFYIQNILYQYENSKEENFVKNQIKNISKEDLNRFILDNNLKKGEYETSTKSIIDGYKELINNKNIVVKKTETENVFDAFYRERKIFTVEIEENGSVKKLGMLSYTIWKIKNIIPYLDRGLYYYDIYVPSNCILKINNKEVIDSFEEEKIKGLEELYYYENMPKLHKYQINNLITDAKIEIIKDKKSIKYSDESYVIKNDNVFSKFETYEESRKHLSSEIDIMKIAETWSLFLTKDLTGTYHGLNTVNEFLVPNSYMAGMASSWAKGIDITFTSSHTLKNPIFTNEKMENFIIYDENAFTCEVYLEKNMVVSGNSKIDIMHDKMSFIKYNNEWKLVALEAITN